MKLVTSAKRDATTIQRLAEKIGYPTYGPLLSEGQIRFMITLVRENGT